MRKYNNVSETDKSRREAEDKRKKLQQNPKKVTDFFDASEPKSNSVETTSNRPNATALHSNPYAVSLSDDL